MKTIQLSVTRMSVCAATLIVLLASSLSAQITGDLNGAVLDGSGSVVPAAKLTLKSLETGVTRTAGVSADGVFVFNLLKIGMYEVKAEAPGFRSTLTQVEVKTGETGNIQFRLEVGQVTETITVSDAVTRLDTENAQIQRSFTGASIQEIPVNRNPNLFALSAPGVTPVSSNNSFLGSGSFNSNGGRGRGNNIMVDGITATDVSVTGTGGPLGPLNFSAIKEVKIITNNFSAEYGRNASSQVLYITKNGTNELRGEAYYYVQNNVFNARPFFDRTGKTNITKVNTAGWSVGGPVFIPKVVDGRNRVFWHTTYERFWQRGAGATRIARVPTPAQVASITDPTSKALFDQYKVPTSPNGQMETAAPNKSDTYQFAIRGDVSLTSRDTLWARYSIFDNKSESTSLTFVGSNLPGFGASSTNHPRQATLAETHVFGASAVNEFRFGFGQSKPNFPIQTPYPLGTRIIFGSAEVTSLGVWEGLPQGREQRTYQYSDNFSMVRGSHNLKFGGEYYNLEADSIFDSFQRPVLTYATFADYARGVPATYQQRFGNSQRANRVKNVFAFAQDDWKVTRTFTVNLGLRMEFAGGPTEANRLISNLNLNNTTSYGAAGTGPFGLLENGKPAFDSNYNWGPRLGFAWSPGKGRTVIRGGYGIAYDFVFLNPITNQRFLPPFIVTGSLSGAASFTGNNSPDKIVAGTAQIQAETKAQVGALAQNVLNFGAISPAIAQNLSNSQVQHWNLGVQREFAHVVFKASYVGTKGTFLTRTRDINLIASPLAAATSIADEDARLPQFQAAFAGLSGGATRRSNRIDGRYNTVAYVESSANSIYHSLQLEAQKRWDNGFLFNVAYAYGKAMDDNSDVLGVLVNDSANQQDPRNNRNNSAVSQFDIRQRLSVAYVWEPQFFKRSSNIALRTILGGWGMAGTTGIRSGFPLTLLAGTRLGITDPISILGGGAAMRPNTASAFSLNLKPAGSEGAPFGSSGTAGRVTSNYAQSLGLTQPFLGGFGTLGRNTNRVNGEVNFDWNLYKNFIITEQVRFQIRAEFYNLFNNTSFQDVARTITQNDFGQYTTVGQNARFMQLGARFIF